MSIRLNFNTSGLATIQVKQGSNAAASVNSIELNSTTLYSRDFCPWLYTKLTFGMDTTKFPPVPTMTSTPYASSANKTIITLAWTPTNTSKNISFEITNQKAVTIELNTAVSAAVKTQLSNGGTLNVSTTVHINFGANGVTKTVPFKILKDGTAGYSIRALGDTFNGACQTWKDRFKAGAYYAG